MEDADPASGARFRLTLADGQTVLSQSVVIASGVVTADGPASADSFGNIFAELLDGSRTRSGRVTR